MLSTVVGEQRECTVEIDIISVHQLTRGERHGSRNAQVYAQAIKDSRYTKHTKPRYFDSIRPHCLQQASHSAYKPEHL